MIICKQDEINMFLLMFKIDWLTIFCCHGINVYAGWVQTCGLTSLFENVNISNLTLCTLMNQTNLRVASTLQHNWRSNMFVWNCQLKIVLVENLVCKAILRINKHTQKQYLKCLGNLVAVDDVENRLNQFQQNNGN